MSKSMDSKSVRIQFEISAKLAQELEQFEKDGDMNTHREFFVNAITLWRWAFQKSREGKTIAALEDSEDQLRYTELSLPGLDSVRRDALALRALSMGPIATHQA